MILLGTFQCSRYVHIIRHAATMYDVTRTILDVHIFIRYDMPQYDASRTYTCIIPYGTIRHGTNVTVRCYLYDTTCTYIHSIRYDTPRYDAIRTERHGMYVYIPHRTMRHGTMLFVQYEKARTYTLHTVRYDTVRCYFYDTKCTYIHSIRYDTPWYDDICTVRHGK